MDRKHLTTGITSGAVCLLVGFLFGYIAGTDMVPGMHLSGADMDFETRIMALQMEQSGQMEGQLAQQMEELQERNAILQEAQAHLQTLRGYQFSGRTTAPDAAISDFFTAQGISLPLVSTGDNYTDSDWQYAIDSLRDFIESLNNTNQMDIIRLQALMNKQQQAYQIMSNIMKVNGDTQKSIINNMR